MRQLKITKSTTRKQVPFINEWLKSKDFSLDEFVRKIAEAEQLIEHKENCLLNDFQNLESICVLAFSHLHGRSYADMIADVREGGGEINSLRWLSARRVLSIALEYENSGKPMQELLLAAMQGVKNAAFAYNFNPKISFIDFAAPIIRRHIEQYIQDGESSFAALYREYKEILDNAKLAYDNYCNPVCNVAAYSAQPEKAREHLFANAKISRCRKEIRMAADYAEWRLVDVAVHLPDDYDERDKFIRTASFTSHDALYCGECKDLVKPVGGEWSVCTANGVRVPVGELTDRDSMRNAMEALLDVLENIPRTRTLGFREWRAEKDYICFDG